jgi:hypothetical protein
MALRLDTQHFLIPESSCVGVAHNVVKNLGAWRELLLNFRKELFKSAGIFVKTASQCGTIQKSS